KVDRFTTNSTKLVFKGDEEGAVSYALYLNSAGYLRFTGAFVNLRSPVGSVQPGQWYHVAVVADRAAAQLRMYLDGAAVAAHELADPFEQSTGPLVLAGVDTGGEGEIAGFEGTLDEVRIWSVARTAAQIAAAKD